MPSLPFLHNFYRSPFRATALGISTTTATAKFVQFQLRIAPFNFRGKALIAAAASRGSSVNGDDHPSIVLDSLRVLQWDQLCDCVASFAGTTLGKQATKDQLWNLNKTYQRSIRLLEETKAAVEMHKYGAMTDFTGIDVALVETGIKCARRGFPVSGSEAMALVVLLRLAETLQFNVKAAIKEDSDWFVRFMPLSELITELVISQSLIKFIEQLVDEDGSVKDSASSNLRQSRDRVRLLEKKLYLLMENVIRNEAKETPTLEICNIDGRWCISSVAARSLNIEGLLLASGAGAGAGNIIEPLSAVPLNDELQQARDSVAKAEQEVLLKITKKMQIDLNDIENIFNSIIKIDTINARAKYSLSFEGACPDLYLVKDKDRAINAETPAEEEILLEQTRRTWIMYLPKAHHPLLLQKHRHSLQMAMKDLSNANAEIRRRKQLGGSAKFKEDLNVSALEMQVAKLKQVRPVPFDILISQKTRVLIITGPNTGGKTICLKTVGLAAMMAKSGLYVLASEGAKVPWFDYVLADIGDEQSLSQSLSTFSGHLKQISEIKGLSTSLSLVLLDEVGAGTNPLEGAALGMSLLESFADSGALLTVASTHHGELKSLKYSNNAFENACMEFDEVELKPTYRVLWGVPGRSNAINIAERLGLPVEILSNARKLYGAASAEINEVIMDMERFKQDYHEKVHESQHYLRISKKLYQSLLLTRNRVTEHRMMEKQRMVQEISKMAASARSTMHKNLRESRSRPTPLLKQTKTEMDKHASNIVNQHAAATGENRTCVATESSEPVDNTKQSITEKKLKLPKAGDMVNVPSLNKKAAVLEVDLSKEEVVVQAGFLKVKLKLADIVPC
ncbi:endonuclease MutS2 [Salvia hispanica]|uniref:endonuclease MutS2 n=1 Tax=Salvia hispanica TaxID=49212 RepID=UPI002009B9FF|nr:endonuclease MutS2 [Salvia hispanica]